MLTRVHLWASESYVHVCVLDTSSLQTLQRRLRLLLLSGRIRAPFGAGTGSVAVSFNFQFLLRSHQDPATKQ